MRNFLYLAAIVATVAASAHFAFDLSRAGSPSFFFVIGLPTLVLAAIAVLRARHDGILKDWLSVRAGDFTRGFTAAAALFASAYIFMRVVAPPSSIRASWFARLYLQLGDPTVLRKNVVIVVAFLIVMSAAEEFVWRGLVTTLLEEKLGTQRAWVWAAVLYALAQAPTVWALRDPIAGPNPILLLAGLGGGLLWGGMARKYERLLPGFFSHVLFDWTVVMMFRLWGPSV